jgi:predicted dehydrogenase
MGNIKKYVQVGLGGRSKYYWNSIVKKYKDSATLVAICDNNPGRLQMRKNELSENGIDVKAYLAKDFDIMIKETSPDVVIVTTRDCNHHEYICRAMELGCDAISEKPMTTDLDKCQKILDTQKTTGKKCRVTFNYRYAPPRTQLKELLMSGLIGDITSVDFHWMLNTSHGADYFRRWHRDKKNSGGLMVHKATHHFDLVNWWLSSVPETVYATGKRDFYTPETAERFGLTNRGERCHECMDKDKCPFYLNMEGNGSLKHLYLDNEQHDGYYRDRCVFSPDINIEDTMNVSVKYRSGATMSYSLVAFSPWEGFTITFNGTRGRIEHKCEESVYINGDGKTPGELVREGTWTKVYPHFLPAYEVDVWKGQGGHGGGDIVLMDDLLSETPAEDKYKRAADQRAGAWSIITGIAANKSIDTGAPVNINDLLPELEEPDYPDMPKPYEKISEEELNAIFAEKLSKAKT